MEDIAMLTPLLRNLTQEQLRAYLRTLTPSQLRAYSLTTMLRSNGIKHSPRGRCACGKTISANKTECFACGQKQTAA